MVRIYTRDAFAQAGEFARDWAAFLQIANSRAAEILDKRFKGDKRKASKGGRELWYVNHIRGEKWGGSFSFNTEKGVAHDFADRGFDTDLIGQKIRTARQVGQFMPLSVGISPLRT